MERKGTVVLLSGGLDSAVALAWAKQEGRPVRRAVSFMYAQSHGPKEIQAAQKIASYYDVTWNAWRLSFELIRAINNPKVGHLLQYDINPREAHNTTTDVGGHQVSATFVPGRNIAFLALAGGLCDASGYDEIVLGVNHMDYSGYPDCRPEFIANMQLALRTGLRFPVEITAPLQHATKAEIIKAGLNMKVPLHLTWSCYLSGNRPCGKCPSCEIRAAGFLKAGVPDPALEA